MIRVTYHFLSGPLDGAEVCAMNFAVILFVTPSDSLAELRQFSGLVRDYLDTYPESPVSQLVVSGAPVGAMTSPGVLQAALYVFAGVVDESGEMISPAEAKSIERSLDTLDTLGTLHLHLRMQAAPQRRPQ